MIDDKIFESTQGIRSINKETIKEFAYYPEHTRKLLKDIKDEHDGTRLQNCKRMH